MKLLSKFRKVDDSWKQKIIKGQLKRINNIEDNQG